MTWPLPKADVVAKFVQSEDSTNPAADNVVTLHGGKEGKGK